jgi:hypothetical protein
VLVEELTKSVLESGLLREEGDRYVLNGALPPFAIPTSLHDSLMARLDRLASIRHVAQIGAAIGREFSYGLLRAVSHLADAELQTALARLVASELVFQRAAPPEAIYTFKHALVQDAAHGSLLRSARQQLHAQIAASLETHFPEMMENQPELFAQHYVAGSAATARAIALGLSSWLSGVAALSRRDRARLMTGTRLVRELINGRAYCGRIETSVLNKAGDNTENEYGCSLTKPGGVGVQERTDIVWAEEWFTDRAVLKVWTVHLITASARTIFGDWPRWHGSVI